jgi:hypothetical protein
MPQPDPPDRLDERDDRSRPSRPQVPQHGARPEAPHRPAEPEPLHSHEPQNDAADDSAGGDYVSALRSVVVDDDAVIVPPPSPDVFAPRGTTTPGAARARGARDARDRAVHFRRTAIPVLLTLGVFVPSLGCAWFFLGEESALRQLDRRLVIACIVAGPVLLGLAVINMIQVRGMLAAGKGSR